MLLAVLLHLLIFHLLTASDAPLRKDTGYKIQQVDTCPDVGYFLKREATANSLEPNVCYLCFCQGDHSAVCWKRDNRRCSKESFHYHGVAKRNTRIKRSPGFSDIFFRDASRDYFNKNTKTQCKPYESSFSDDCPPADWCVGCTVCDCDSNGRWDCHLLSFCPDDKKKSKHRGSPPGAPRTWTPAPDAWTPPPGAWLPSEYLENKKHKVNKNSSISLPKRKSIPVKNIKIAKKAKNKATPQIKREAKKKPSPRKRIAKKNVPLKSGMTPEPGKMRTPIKYTKVAPSKPNSTKKMIIKKNIATRKPIKIKSSKVNSEKAIAHKMMKKIVHNLRKTVASKMRNMSEKVRQNVNEIRNMKARAKLNQIINKSKNVNKRQIKKPPKKMSKVPVKKPVYRAKGKTSRKSAARQYIRHRRDVTMAGTTGVPASGTHRSSAESTNTTVVLTVMPVPSYPQVPKDGNLSHTLTERSTPPENRYYKYIVGTEEPKAKTNNTRETTTSKRFNLTETVFNLIGTQLNFDVSANKPKKHIINDEASKSNNFTEIKPIKNKLKYSKWTDTKIFKEKKIISESDIKHKGLMKWMPHINKTIILEDKNRGFTKTVERKLNFRKYNMVKLLNHSKCKFEDCKMNSSNIQIATRNKDPMHGFSTKILNDSYKSISTTYRPKRKRKPGVLKYLKGIFNRIFKGSKRHDHLSKHQLVETLCENFGPCKVSRKDKSVLNSKLTDLDRETKRILKTVRIIKGLLKLLQLPESVNNEVLTQDNLRNDIQKLNIILKGNYSDNEQVALTDTQRTQIEYIKRNTQDFILSVNKFALLLSDVITILTKEEAKRFKNDLKDHFMNKIKDPFQSLRILLLRYNLIQNKFMKHMYEQLNNFEHKINEKPKVSEVKDLNNTVEIEAISRNIIQNLRKLKRLAQTVSYSGRTKREIVRDDDAIEYLLMLMEYLVKQNHPLDAEPANDGIDLLIEAIKSAPDIKPIKKKVLEDAPVLYTQSTTTTTPKTIPSERNKEEDRPEIEKSSSDDSDKSNLEATELKLNDNKDLVEIVSDDEKEFEDKQFERRAEPDKTDEITEMSFFSKLESNLLSEPENTFETTTYKNMMALEMEISDKLEGQDDPTTEKALMIESSDLEKPIEQSERNAEKKFEVFTEDPDEEVTVPSTVTMTETEIPTTISPEYPTQAMKSRTKLLYAEHDTVVKDNVDTRSKLKWIEENFGKEPEKGIIEFEDSNLNNSTLGITPVTDKTVSEKPPATIDVSSMTKEKEEDSASKKDTDKLSAEEVMFRKQMELLNSLDYGTERQEVYEIDSKDSNVDERYTGDSFPSYFV